MEEFKVGTGGWSVKLGGELSRHKKCGVRTIWDGPWKKMQNRRSLYYCRG